MRGSSALSHNLAEHKPAKRTSYILKIAKRGKKRANNPRKYIDFVEMTRTNHPNR